MSYLEVSSPEQAQPQAWEILTSIKNKLGKIPNIYAAMAHSNVALPALLSFKENLSKGDERCMK